MKKALLSTTLLLLLGLLIIPNVQAQEEEVCCCQAVCKCTRLGVVSDVPIDQCYPWLDKDLWFFCDPEAICKFTCLFKGKYTSYEGTCTGPCPITFLLGSDDPRLATARQFRDAVLTRSDAGKKLMQMYYKNGQAIIDIFKYNPAIKSHAKQVVASIMPVVQSLLDGTFDITLLSDELLNDIDDLIVEMQAAAPNAEFKEILSTVKINIVEAAEIK